MADRGRGARGRARGRARGTDSQSSVRSEQPQAQQGAISRRPQAPPAVVAEPPQGGGSGRAVQRGGQRGEPRTAPTVVQQIAAMSLEPKGDSGDDNGRRAAGRGASRGRGDVFPEPTVTPSAGSGKQGAFGNKVDLMANYFRVDRLPDMNIYQYHVNFSPEIESVAMRRALMGSHREMFVGYLFDNMTLWSTTKLHHEITEVFSERRSDGEKIQIKIKFIREVPPKDPVIIQILNTQMRKNFRHLDFKLINLNYVDVNDASQLPKHKLEIIPGFSTAIRQHENSVLMNCDLCFKIMRQDTVYNLLKEIRRNSPQNFRADCDKQLLGQIVLTRYNNKTYRVDEVKWDMNPTYAFPKRDGSEITLIDYMKVQWSLVVSDHRQPLLMSKPKARDLKRGNTTPILLIPEFCIVTGLTDEMREDYRVMKDVAQYTRVNPEQRVSRLKAFLLRLSTNPQVQKEMNDWGMGFSRDLQRITGRMIGPENIIMSTNANDQGSAYNPQNADWGNIVRGSRLLQPVKLERWILMCTVRDRPVAEDFLTNMMRVCPPMGMVLQRPNQIFVPDDRTGTFVKFLRDNMSQDVQMVVVVMPNQKKDRYDAIKKICCVEYAVPSQVVVTRTLMKKQQLMSIATKIAIQMNCKLGGQVWRVPIPLTKLMVIGIDSYHDSAQKNMSVFAFVATMNQYLTTYFSQVSFQTRGQEMGDTLVTKLSDCFRRYHQINGYLPERIIVYRDGVGDGQLPTVREWEIAQLHTAISSQGQNYTPKILFIVVNKRIGTRIFKRDGGDHSSNPLSGTVVDTEVTQPQRFDFYLISQSVREGTVAPTQYNVIYDTSSLQATHIQRLTYKMCHLYFNWQGTIRVPAPCQYAHKLAFLVGQSLHANPSQRLADTLYYL